MTNEHKEISSVTFFGGAIGEEGDAHYDAALQIASLVAKSGRVVVNGGGPGVMLAATSGAKAAGGRTSVVYYRPELATNFKGEVAANVADVSTEEANYVMRTKKLLELGDAFIIFKGGTGTISEFAMAWGVARLYIDHYKPLILYGQFWHEIVAAFKKNMNIRPDEEKVYTIVTTPQEAMEAIDKFEALLVKANHKHEECKGPECTLFIQ
jgi:uncharacterized protein (TIGR00730 family)